MASEKRYVRLDEHGVWRVGDTHVMFDSVLAGFRQGQSPETIRQSYPSLTLEQVYGSIADYLANQTEFDDYLRRQDEVWARERARSEARPNPVRDRLRRMRLEAAKQLP